MAYAFAPRANSITGQANNLDLPISDWAGVKFDDAANSTIFGAISRFAEDQIWDGPDLMRPDLATSVFGIPGYLKFDDPISIQRARLLRERKDAELRRLSYLESATHSTLSVKAGVGLLAGMAGSASNPLDLSAMFIPFVGSEAAAAGVAKMGGSGLRQAFARGLLTTEESLGTFTRFPKFGASVINGALGNALTEIPVFAQNVRDKAIYGPTDSALNIAMGGLAGGALHIGGALISRALGRAREAHESLDPATRDAALRKATNDALNDRPIDVAGIIRTDRDAILRDLKFDEAESRRRALESIGILPEEAQARAILEGMNRSQASALDLLDLTRFKANSAKDSVDGRIAARLLERFSKGERTPEVFNQMADLFGVRYNPLAPTLQERLKTDRLGEYYGDVPEARAAELTRLQQEKAAVEQTIADARSLLDEATDELTKRQLRSNIHNAELKLGRLEPELKSAVGAASRGPLTPDEIQSHADALTRAGRDLHGEGDSVRAAQLQARADEIRAARIQEFIDSERAQTQADLDDRMSPETTERIRNDVEAGKFLDDSEVEALVLDPTNEASLTSIKESIASLESDLKVNDPKDPIGSIVKSELDKMKDAPDLRKAYDEAMKCLIETL